VNNSTGRRAAKRSLALKGRPRPKGTLRHPSQGSSRPLGGCRACPGTGMGGEGRGGEKKGLTRRPEIRSTRAAWGRTGWAQTGARHGCAVGRGRAVGCGVGPRRWSQPRRGSTREAAPQISNAWVVRAHVGSAVLARSEQKLGRASSVAQISELVTVQHRQRRLELRTESLHRGRGVATSSKDHNPVLFQCLHQRGVRNAGSRQARGCCASFTKATLLAKTSLSPLDSPFACAPTMTSSSSWRRGKSMGTSMTIWRRF
jgi:hypothetical protein